MYADYSAVYSEQMLHQLVCINVSALVHQSVGCKHTDGSHHTVFHGIIRGEGKPLLGHIAQPHTERGLLIDLHLHPECPQCLRILAQRKCIIAVVVDLAHVHGDAVHHRQCKADHGKYHQNSRSNGVPGQCKTQRKEQTAEHNVHYRAAKIVQKHRQLAVNHVGGRHQALTACACNGQPFQLEPALILDEHK